MRIIFALTGVLLGLVPTSFAVTITTGTFGFSGTIVATGSGGVITPAGTCPVGITCVFWQDPAMTANNRVDINPTGLPNGDIPFAISGFDAAAIFDLDLPPAGVGATFPAFPFMTFLNGGITTVLDINFIAAGIFGSASCSAPPAAGQTCTVPGSFFNFQNTTSNSSVAEWSFSGVTNDSSSTWTATFSTQFSTSFQDVLASFTSSGFLSGRFSGGGITSLAANGLAPAPLALNGVTSITLTAVPEPQTLSLTVGTGLMGLLLFLRGRLTNISTR